MRRDVFQAIADPTRREIIALLVTRSQTPNNVAEKFNLSRQAISKHIRILTECGLLTYQVQGREYHYTIQPKKLNEVYDWLEPLKQMWEARFSQLDKVLLQNKHAKKVKS